VNKKNDNTEHIENNNITIAKKIAEDIKNKNGRMFYVGGYVRDKILDPSNTNIKDIDVEVFNIKPEELKSILSKYGIVDEFGVNFGIIKIHGINIDFSMPRKEKNIGEGHKNFEVSVDPYMSIIDSARRRDFTINAILEDVLTGERFDFFNGILDIENKIIRHIDDKTFVEDELRVLRACQFAARFDFKIANETINLCRQININTLSLPKERVFGELEKALLKSDKPSIFFEYAKEIGFLKDMFFPIDKLIGLKQNPVYHPEGDVWNHTMLVIDEAAKLKNKSNYPIAFMIAALCHDLGKIFTTKVLENGKIVSYNHENDMDVISRFLKNITNNKDLISSVKLLVKNHMRPNILVKENSTDKAIRKLIVDTSGKIVNIYDAILLSKADRLGRNINEINNSSLEIWWKNRLSKVIGEKTTLEPLIKGRDLISMGFVPNREFKDMLDRAFKLQIEGFDKKEILQKLGIK
jgi:tRNA nucleotidyltransferase (CCA-adding enzyme)